MDWEQFLQLVITWAEQNERKIKDMWPQKGGWEKWAQPEIVSFINSRNVGVSIEREQPVYKPQLNKKKQKDADILLNDNNMMVSEKVIVELKTQSFNNFTNFVPGLKKDTQKLIEEVSPSYSGSTFMVIGLYFTEENTEIPNYFSKKVIGKGEIGICWAVDQNS